MSSKTSSRSTLTMVPSTMSPSLKYLMVLSMAARKSSEVPMSLTATCGEVTEGLGMWWVAPDRFNRRDRYVVTATAASATCAHGYTSSLRDSAHAGQTRVRGIVGQLLSLWFRRAVAGQPIVHQIDRLVERAIPPTHQIDV